MEVDDVPVGCHCQEARSHDGDRPVLDTGDEPNTLREPVHEANASPRALATARVGDYRAHGRVHRSLDLAHRPTLGRVLHAVGKDPAGPFPTFI